MEVASSDAPGSPFQKKGVHGRGISRRSLDRERTSSPTRLLGNRSSSSLDAMPSGLQSPASRSMASNHDSFSLTQRNVRSANSKPVAFTQRRDKETTQRTCANLSLLLGVAVMIESLGVAVGGASHGNFSVFSTLRTAGAFVVLIFSFPILYYLCVLPTAVPDSALVATLMYFGGVVLRVCGEGQILARVWEFPLLPKLSAAYCNVRRSEQGGAECGWHSGMNYFRLKEISAMASGFLFAALFVLSVAVVFSRNLGWGVREWASFRIVVGGLCLVLAESAVGEGIILPAQTMQGIRSEDDPLGMRGKLALAVAGSTVEAVGALGVLCTLRWCLAPSSKAIAAACAFVSIGMLLRLVGEIEQLHPTAVWTPLGVDDGQTVEIVLKILADMLCAVATLCFSALCLQKRCVFFGMQPNGDHFKSFFFSGFSKICTHAGPGTV